MAESRHKSLVKLCIKSFNFIEGLVSYIDLIEEVHCLEYNFVKNVAEAEAYAFTCSAKHIKLSGISFNKLCIKFNLTAEGLTDNCCFI